MRHSKFVLLFVVIILATSISNTFAAPVDSTNCGGVYDYTTGGAGKRTETSGYGSRTPPATIGGGTGSAFHQGVDIGMGASNTTGDYNAYSTLGGTVASVGYQNGYGYTVVIDNGNGVRTTYAHATTINVTQGQTVTAGQILSNYSGATSGNSSGAHLHYAVSVLQDGNWVNVDPATVENMIAQGECPSSANFASDAVNKTISTFGTSLAAITRSGDPAAAKDACASTPATTTTNSDDDDDH